MQKWLLSGELVPSILNGIALVAMLASWVGAIYLWFLVRPMIHSSWTWLIGLFPFGVVFGPIYIIKTGSRFIGPRRKQAQS